jgi:hypothetical protein
LELELGSWEDGGCIHLKGKFRRQNLYVFSHNILITSSQSTGTASLSYSKTHSMLYCHYHPNIPYPSQLPHHLLPLISFASPSTTASCSRLLLSPSPRNQPLCPPALRLCRTHRGWRRAARWQLSSRRCRLACRIARTRSRLRSR